MDARRIAAGKFKQGCLAILDEVESKQVEVIITKRGRPVAKLVPLQPQADREKEILDALRGRARQLVDEDEFLAPTSGEWDGIDGRD